MPTHAIDGRPFASRLLERMVITDTGPIRNLFGVAAAIATGRRLVAETALRRRLCALADGCRGGVYDCRRRCSSSTTYIVHSG